MRTRITSRISLILIGWIVCTPLVSCSPDTAVVIRDPDGSVPRTDSPIASGVDAPFDGGPGFDGGTTDPVRDESTGADGYVWRPVRIGGGGWVTGLALHPTAPGVVYARTDVGGAYRWDPATATWQQMMTARRVPLDGFTGIGNAGAAAIDLYAVESIAVAPSDPAIVVLACGNTIDSPGWFLRSTDSGSTFTVSRLPVPAAGNAEHRTVGERLAIQPDDANVVLFGSRTAGLFRSTNGGTDWVQVSADEIPTGGAVGGTPLGVSPVLFDPTQPRRVYASVGGVGIYRSDDAGVTFESILPGVWANDMEISGGVLYMAGPEGTRRYDGTTWTEITPAGDRNITDLAVDPSNSNRLFAVNGGGFSHAYRSTDGGANWTELGTNSGSGRDHFRSPNIPWVESSTVRNWLSVGALSVDPTEPSHLWFSEGMGMWRSTDATDDNLTPNFDNVSTGIEEMVSNDIVALPGGHLVEATWDRLGFHHSNPDLPPTSQLGLSNEFTSGWSLATSASDPNYVASVVSDHRFCCGDGVFAGTSIDRGETWNRFPANAGGSNSPNELRFGELAVSATDTRNLVWLPRYGAQLAYYSTDGGGSWAAASPGLDDWNSFFFGNRRRLAADGASAGTFYVYRWTDGSVIVSSDGGAHFEDRGGRLPSYTYWSQLKAVPGRAGHLFFASGYDQGPDNDGLFRSVDGAASFTRVPGFEDTWAVGYGRPESPGGYPTIYVYGSRDGLRGIFRSTDEAATFVRITEYPLGIFDRVMVITGDPDVFGRVYVGFAGNSFAYGTPR